MNFLEHPPTSLKVHSSTRWLPPLATCLVAILFAFAGTGCGDSSSTPGQSFDAPKEPPAEIKGEPNATKSLTPRERRKADIEDGEVKGRRGGR